jgi:hypothetical protein
LCIRASYLKFIMFIFQELTAEITCQSVILLGGSFSISGQTQGR